LVSVLLRLIRLVVVLGIVPLSSTWRQGEMRRRLMMIYVHALVAGVKVVRVMRLGCLCHGGF
jgi:hypothetical protein